MSEIITMSDVKKIKKALTRVPIETEQLYDISYKKNGEGLHKAERNVSYVIATNMRKVLDYRYEDASIEAKKFLQTFEKKYNLGISSSLFSLYQKGERDVPLVFVYAFCDHFGISIDDLFLFEPKVDSQKNALEVDSESNKINSHLKQLVANSIKLSEIAVKKSKEIEEAAQEASEKAVIAFEMARRQAENNESYKYIIDEDNDRIYGGEVQDGLPHGHGVESFNKGKIKYSGQWEKGDRKGFGVLESKDDNTYCAREWGVAQNTYCGVYEKSNRMCAFSSGSINSKKKSCRYMGEMIGTDNAIVLEGYGSCSCKGEFSYIGQFKEDVWHGYGCMFVFDSPIRTGKWDKEIGLVEDVNDFDES